MGSPLFAIASFAVYLIVRTIARNYGVQGFGAVPALEALPVPGSSFRKDLLGGEDNATTSRTSFAQRSLNLLHIYDRGLGSHIANKINIFQEIYLTEIKGIISPLPFAIFDIGHQPQGRNANVSVAPSTKLLSITSCNAKRPKDLCPLNSKILKIPLQ